MVNIDDVYQKVLAVANKEQRGYITPQEFNLFADHAQMEIFEQYFYDLNQFTRVPGNIKEYGDIISNLNEKINFFSVQGADGLNLPNDLYRLGDVYHVGAGNGMTSVEKIERKDLPDILRSPLLAPTPLRRIYVRRQDNSIDVYPQQNTQSIQVRYDYVRMPAKPSWGYFVVGDKALHDSDPIKTTNFELHPSEENELVYKILKLAGISMQNIDVMKAAQGLESIQVSQEKQ